MRSQRFSMLRCPNVGVRRTTANFCTRRSGPEEIPAPPRAESPVEQLSAGMGALVCAAPRALAAVCSAAAAGVGQQTAHLAFRCCLPLRQIAGAMDVTEPIEMPMESQCPPGKAMKGHTWNYSEQNGCVFSALAWAVAVAWLRRASLRSVLPASQVGAGMASSAGGCAAPGGRRLRSRYAVL